MTLRKYQKDLILFSICLLPGPVSLIISIVHRSRLTSHSYVDNKFIFVEFFFLIIFILAIFIFLISSIIFRLKDRECKIIFIDILLLAFLLITFFTVICIDYPTLIYMT